MKERTKCGCDRGWSVNSTERGELQLSCSSELKANQLDYKIAALSFTGYCSECPTLILKTAVCFLSLNTHNDLSYQKTHNIYSTYESIL